MFPSNIPRCDIVQFGQTESWPRIFLNAGTSTGSQQLNIYSSQRDPSFDQVFSLVKEYGFLLSLGDQVTPLCLRLQDNELVLRTGGHSWAGTGLACSTSSLASSTCSPQCNTCIRPGSKPLMNTIPAARKLLSLSTGNSPQFSFSIPLSVSHVN